MASLHDELAKASALAAFGKFKESPKIEEFRGVLAALWAEHEPLMKEAARSGHPQYEFVCATDYDFSIKEIEEFMLPTAWAALQKAGHTFNWKFDQEIPFRYSFKIRWHRKREDILKRLKEEYHAKQETEEDLSNKKQCIKEPEVEPPPDGTPELSDLELPEKLDGFMVLFHCDKKGWLWGRVLPEREGYSGVGARVRLLGTDPDQTNEYYIRRADIRNVRFWYKKVGTNGSMEF